MNKTPTHTSTLSIMYVSGRSRLSLILMVIRKDSKNLGWSKMSDDKGLTTMNKRFQNNDSRPTVIRSIILKYKPHSSKSNCGY
jgi:hypothetical protein